MAIITILQVRRLRPRGLKQVALKSQVGEGLLVDYPTIHSPLLLCRQNPISFGLECVEVKEYTS